MSPRKPRSKPDRDDPREWPLTLVRVIEFCRVLRWAIVGATVVLGLAVVTWGATKIYARPPAWEIVLGAIVTLAAPSGVIVVLVRSRRKFVAKLARRTRELEQRLDPQRTSSADDQEGSQGGDPE